MVIVSIDGSTTATGLAAFLDGDLAGYTAADLSKTKDYDKRKYPMHKEIFKFLEVWKPDIVVIEKVPQVRNVEVFRRLCKIMGAVDWWATNRGIEYIEIVPSEWRRFAKDEDEKLPRKSAELKQWCIEKVHNKYGITVSDDVADAILIGCGFLEKMKNGEKDYE